MGNPDPAVKRDLPQAASVRIRDVAPVIRAVGNGIELAQVHWSFPPPKPSGKPVFNFRSEGRSFRDSRRCLIPATAVFHFTGQRAPKTKDRFTPASPSSASPGSGVTVPRASDRAKAPRSACPMARTSSGGPAGAYSRSVQIPDVEPPQCLSL
jgi:hypothetical protein